MAQETVVPPPPRLDFDPQDARSMADAMRSLIDWMHIFYSAAVVESGLLDPNFQASAPEFDPDNLPDPADTSIARAQQTANAAYTKADEGVGKAEDALGRSMLLATEFTLSGANNEITLTFAADMADDEYCVIVQATGFTGPVIQGAFIPVKITKTTTDCTITMAVAPGTGASATFQAFIFPSI